MTVVSPEPNKGFTTRELVTLAVFGTLWGVFEMTLGSVIKALNVPMAGMMLGMIGLSIAMIGRLFVPKRGSVLFIGFIALFLRLFSISGGLLIGPMIGILMESLIAEIVLSLIGKPGRFPFMLAASLALVWNIAQPFIMSPIFYGRSVYVVWLDLFDKMSYILGFNAAALLLIVYTLIHITAGCLAGVFAWDVGRRIKTRMRAASGGSAA